MIFRLTNKLAEKIKEDPLPHFEETASNPYLEWYANYFTIQKYQYILVINASSLLSIVMYGRGITDIDRFKEQFAIQLEDLLLKMDCEMILRRIILPNLSPLIVAKTASRTILGNMNEMKKMIEIAYFMHELNPVEMTDHLNQTPFNTIGFMTPEEKFKSMGLGGE